MGGAYNQLLHLADTGRQLELNDLIYLLLKRNLIAFHEVTGAHDVDQLSELYQNLVRYLMWSTYVNQAEAVKEAIDAALKKHEERADESSVEFQQLLEKMMSTGLDHRRYHVAVHVEYLIFEYFMKIIIRENQVKALKELQIVDGKIQNEKALGGVIELIMSAGKTSVLLPLLSVLHREGEALSIAVLPESLINSMSKELHASLKSSFGRSIDVISFSRERYLGRQDLQLLYERLTRARVENRTLVTTNSTIQSLFLSFIERLYRYPKDANQVRDEVEIFGKIFRYLRTYGRLTIDEVDLALDILQAHQFSVGESISLLRGKVAALHTLPATVFSFYHLIATTPKLHQAIDLPFLYYSRGHGAITATSYQKFRNTLVETLLQIAAGRDTRFFVGFDYLNRPFKDFLQDFKNSNLAQTYLLSDKMEARNDLFRRIDQVGGNAETATYLKDIFAILHEEIQTVFLLTTTKKMGVHYGRLPKPEPKPDESANAFARRMQTYKASRFVAIPYHSGEPMASSRFGTPVEALNYTLQMWLEQKRFGPLVKEEVEALRALAQKGAGKSKTGRFVQRLKDLQGEGGSYVISAVGDKEITAMVEHVEQNKNIQVQFDLLNRYVVPQITVYPAQIVTNAQIYGELFHSVQGFTGTLWSVDTFPKIFNQPVMSDTSEKTFMILWQDYLANQAKYPAIRTLSKGNLLGKELLNSLVNQVYRDWDKPGSLLDESGIFRAFSNEEVARAILNHASVKDKVNAVIFYDAKDNLRVLEQGGVVREFDASSKAVPGRIAFWDKKHTTGSDLKLTLDMQGKVIVDHHTTSRSLQQTAWRLRGLGMGQQVVEYLAAADDFEIMKKKMTEEWKIPASQMNPFNPGVLILYSVMNQEIRLGDLRVRALKQKMKNVVIRQVLDQMFAEGKSPDEISRLYQQTRALFEKTLDDQALYPSLGIPKHFEDVSKVIEKEEKQILEASYTQAVNASSVKIEIANLIKQEEPSLPRQIISSSVDSGLEVEIESETEQEQEQEEEKEQEAEHYNMNPNHKEHYALEWSLENEKPFSDEFFSAIPRQNLNMDPKLWLYGERLKTRVQPLMTLPDALLSRNKTFLANAFSHDLLISLNYAPLYHQNRFTDVSRYEYDFFGFYHKELSDVLVIWDKASQDVRLVLLDANDVEQWDHFLSKDVVKKHRELQLGLYSLEGGLFRQGAEPLDDKMLAQNENFLQLIVQAKFFAGMADYDKKEEKYLRAFLSGPNPDPTAIKKHAREMLHFFKNEVLAHKRDSQQAFHGSELEAVFLNILGTVD